MTSDRLKIAVAGFRHPHIHDLVTLINERDDYVVVAGCERDESTRAALKQSKPPFPIYTALDEMLRSVQCDVVAVGDYYGVRGSIALQSLAAGKHILSDKPICTSLSELLHVEELAQKNGLSVGCQLDMRGLGGFHDLQRIVRDGTIGDIQAVAFNGQHPLMYGKRAAWYYEDGKHGGTINDIAVHAFDFIPWVTGHEVVKINAARCWSSGREPKVAPFQDAGQLMFTLANGAGVLGDVSYLAPDSFGYTSPFYWEWTFWGTRGVLRTNLSSREVAVYEEGKSEVQLLKVEESYRGGYLDSFRREIRGESKPGDLTSERVLRAARLALAAQAFADSGEGGVEV